MSDDLGKGSPGSEEYFLCVRGPRYFQERINGLNRVEGVHEKQGDGAWLSRKRRIQGVHFVQVKCI